MREAVLAQCTQQSGNQDHMCSCRERRIGINNRVNTPWGMKCPPKTAVLWQDCLLLFVWYFARPAMSTSQHHGALCRFSSHLLAEAAAGHEVDEGIDQSVERQSLEQQRAVHGHLVEVHSRVAQHCTQHTFNMGPTIADDDNPQNNDSGSSLHEL